MQYEVRTKANGTVRVGTMAEVSAALRAGGGGTYKAVKVLKTV